MSPECLERSQSVSNENDIKVDRSSGDFTETKRFWQSKESSTSIDESPVGGQPLPQLPPPVPKPRLQVALVGGERGTEPYDNVVQEMSHRSTSSASASISGPASASVHASEPSEELLHASTEDHLEDESFPMAAKSLDSDSREYGQESLELDSTEHSDKSIYKVREREDILDLDDDEGERSARVEPSAAMDEKKLSQSEQDEEEDRKSASFYIGESSVNVITKSATEKRSDFAFDNDGFESTQDSAHDDRQSKSPAPEMDADNSSNFEQTHEFLEAERQAADSLQLETREISKQSSPETGSEAASVEKSENEYSEKESHLHSEFVEAHRPTITEVQPADLMSSDTSVTEGSPVIMSPAGSVRSRKASDPFDIHSVGSDECKALSTSADPEVVFPTEDTTRIVRDRLDSVEYDVRSIETNEFIVHQSDDDILLVLETNADTKTDAISDERIGSGVVHSPIEAKISNISFDEQPVSILDQREELQQASEIHSPTQTPSSVAATSTQIVHFDSDEDNLLPAKKAPVVHSPIESVRAFDQAEYSTKFRLRRQH